MSIEYSSRSQIAVQKIRTAILSGELQAGQKLNQSRLAADLNISLIPLREALKQLEGEGYLEVVSYSGVFVKELNLEEMEDLYLIREEVETLAGRLALSNLSDKTTKKMKRLLQRMEGATEKLDYSELLAVNREFHYTLYKACGRKFLLSVLEDLWNRSSRYRILGTFNPKRAQEALHEHREILDACLARDEVALTDAIRKNIQKTLDHLLAAPPLGEP